MSLELHPEAMAEYLSAIAWYNEKTSGLGSEFSEEIEKAFDRIEMHPERYRFANQVLRVSQVERFPYSIFYHWNGDSSQILVTSVFHHKRHPKFWQNRSII